MTDHNTCPACGHRLNEYLHCPQACPKCCLPLSMWPIMRGVSELERRLEELERRAYNLPPGVAVATLGTTPTAGEAIPSEEYLRRVREASAPETVPPGFCRVKSKEEIAEMIEQVTEERLAAPEPSKLVCPACAATQWPDGHPCGICGGTGEVECVRKPPAAVPEPRTPISLPDALTLADDIMRRAEDGREEAVVQETIKAEDAVKMLRKVQQEEAAERQQERTAGTWRGVYGQPLSQETAEKILAETAASNAKFAEDFTKQQERQSSDPRKPREWWVKLLTGPVGPVQGHVYVDHTYSGDIPVREILRDENGVEIESEEVRRLRADRDELRLRLASHWGISHIAEIEQLTADLAAEQLERERSDDIITRLRVADAEMDAEVKRLRVELDAYATEVAAKNDMIAKITDENSFLRERLARGGEQQRQGDDEIVKLTAERDALKREREAYRRAGARLYSTSMGYAETMDEAIEDMDIEAASIIEAEAAADAAKGEL